MKKLNEKPLIQVEQKMTDWEKIEAEARKVLKRWEAGGPEAEAEIKEAEKWANEVFVAYDSEPNRYTRRNTKRIVH